MYGQVEAQLEAEKVSLLERKRHEQAERRRTQEELTRILEDNRRKVGSTVPLMLSAGHPLPLARLSCFVWSS